MYSPRIDPVYVEKLYLLKEAYKSKGVHKPMTTLVDEALNKYFKNKMIGEKK